LYHSDHSVWNQTHCLYQCGRLFSTCFTATYAQLPRVSLYLQHFVLYFSNLWCCVFICVFRCRARPYSVFIVLPSGEINNDDRDKTCYVYAAVARLIPTVLVFAQHSSATASQYQSELIEAQFPAISNDYVMQA